MIADNEEISRLIEITNGQAREVADKLIEYKNEFEENFRDEINSDYHFEIQRIYENLRMDLCEAIDYYESLIKENDDPILR